MTRWSAERDAGESVVYAFIFGQKGLMGGLGIQGSKDHPDPSEAVMAGDESIARVLEPLVARRLSAVATVVATTTPARDQEEWQTA